MKKLLCIIVSIVMILLLSGCGNKEVSVDNNNYSTNDTCISDKLTESLSQESTKYDNKLALICAELSEAIEDAYETSNNTIIDKYKELGFDENAIINPEDNKSSYYFSFAYADDVQISDDEYDVLFITARGTKTWAELVNDAVSIPMVPFLKNYSAYQDCYLFCKNAFDKIQQDYVSAHSASNDKKLKVIITGHSLGGAAANLIAAYFNEGIGEDVWWGNITSKKDIYCYTFGAISSIAQENIEDGFENIHNVYNYFDSFGPNQPNPLQKTRNNSINKKFGHIELFGKNEYWYNTYNDTKLRESKQHIMPTYIAALEDYGLNDNGIEKENKGDLHTCNDTERAVKENDTEKENSSSVPVKENVDEKTNNFDLIGKWVASDGATVQFNSDLTFDFDWGLGFVENGTYSIGDYVNEKTFKITMNGTSFIKLMTVMYGIKDSNYHFEVLIDDNNSIYLVQVYGEYTAETSKCKLKLQRTE